MTEQVLTEIQDGVIIHSKAGGRVEIRLTERTGPSLPTARSGSRIRHETPSTTRWLSDTW